MKNEHRDRDAQITVYPPSGAPYSARQAEMYPQWRIGTAQVESKGLGLLFPVVPVVDEDHRPVGMLTDRDICMAAYTQGKPLADLRADTAMARKLICCKCDDDLARALNTMGDNGVRRLPVVGEHGRLVGILSLDDVVVESRKTPRGAIGQELARQIYDVFASICVHRMRRRFRS